jgi:hypothetical protein
MDIEMQYGKSPDDLTFANWDFAFVGKPMDSRGKATISFLETHSNEQILTQYVPKEFRFQFNDDSFNKDDIDEKLEFTKDSSVVLDATTLNFAELLILCQSLKDIEKNNVSIIYVEPGGYNKKHTSEDLLHRRDFELSEETVGYEAIPGHSLLLTRDNLQKVVFICGFESERIDRAMEDSEINNNTCCLIFGVPAFIPGWEMDSFDNNISVLKERKLSGGINFCGATDPLPVLKKLEHIYSGLDDEDQMFVVPLGTKPMNIGACLFLLSKSKERVAVLYDHPLEMKNKGLLISDWHLYNITFN